MAEAERRVAVGVAPVDGGDARVVPVGPGVLRQEQRARKRDRLYERGDDENRRERRPRDATGRGARRRRRGTRRRSRGSTHRRAGVARPPAAASRRRTRRAPRTRAALRPAREDDGSRPLRRGCGDGEGVRHGTRVCTRAPERRLTAQCRSDAGRCLRSGPRSGRVQVAFAMLPVPWRAPGQRSHRPASDRERRARGRASDAEQGARGDSCTSGSSRCSAPPSARQRPTSSTARSGSG